MTQQRTAAMAGTPKIDRLPPHDIEAEQALLGSILLSPDSCMAECGSKIKPGYLVFYDLRHQTLYQMFETMVEARQGIDLVTLQSRLKNAGQLENVGGLAYLSCLPDMTPSGANLAYYIDIVLEKYILRKTIQVCTGIVGRVFDYEGQIDELLDGVEKDILQISQERQTGEMPAVKTLVQNAIGVIETCFNQKGLPEGIKTGFNDFDKKTLGLHDGEMIVIAARPSVGKTSLAMNIAENIAAGQKKAVGVFSLEMSSDQLILRMLCSRARVNLRDMRDGFLHQPDFNKLVKASGELAGCPLYIDDSSGLSVLQLRAKARRMWQEHGIKVFVIDYMQLLNSPSRKNENRQQEIAEISSGIKALAKELHVPVIVLSQLNREIEKRGAGEKPRMSDLRESGAIEQDADLVGLLYRAIEKKEDAEEQDLSEAWPVNLLIAKQRNGPTGEIPLTFIRGYTRFESASKIDKADVQQDLEPARRRKDIDD